MLGEELAVQVVDLVLDAHGQQAIGLQREGLAIQTQRRDGDGVGALDLVVDAGDGQAPFLVALQRVAGPGDLGVDEDLQLVMGLGDIDDHHALVHVDLRGRQPDAGRRVHGLGHVGHQLADSIVHNRDPLGNRMQPGVRILEYV